MSPSEQTDAFQKDIEAVIDRYRKEFDLTLASAIGTLMVVMLDLHEGEKPQ